MEMVSIRADWISRRNSSAAVVRRRFGDRAGVVAFLGRLVPGDELRSFRSPAATWQKRMGRRGYAILRAGRVIDAIVIAMN